MNQKVFINDVMDTTTKVRRSLLKKYQLFLTRFAPFRHLVLYLHRLLNRMQYDPLNPQNRTTENPEGVSTEAEKELALRIERDKNLLDKVETYFRLRPVSTSILAFFVIATAALEARHNPAKIVTALTLIFLFLPLLLSRQDDFIDESTSSPAE